MGSVFGLHVGGNPKTPSELGPHRRPGRDTGRGSYRPESKPQIGFGGTGILRSTRPDQVELNRNQQAVQASHQLGLRKP